MVIFLCQDSPEGIFSGVYDAWTSRLGHKNVKLALDRGHNLELFAEYRESIGTEEKAMKVVEAVKKKISESAYSWIYKASLHCNPDKADFIYRFLIYGFHLGKTVTECLQIPEVNEVFRMNRAIGAETHHLTEFLRFSELEDSVLFSRVGPKHDIVSLLMPHFADRLRPERFVIYDENHQKAGVHTSGTEWYLISGTEAERFGTLAEKSDASEYASLWRAFYNSITIKERENYICQRGHLPLRFRSYMTEFQKN